MRLLEIAIPGVIKSLNTSDKNKNVGSDPKTRRSPNRIEALAGCQYGPKKAGKGVVSDFERCWGFRGFGRVAGGGSGFRARGGVVGFNELGCRFRDLQKALQGSQPSRLYTYVAFKVRDRDCKYWVAVTGPEIIAITQTATDTNDNYKEITKQSSVKIKT